MQPAVSATLGSSLTFSATQSFQDGCYDLPPGGSFRGMKGKGLIGAKQVAGENLVDDVFQFGGVAIGDDDIALRLECLQIALHG